MKSRLKNLSDADLVSLAKEGNASAFEAIYNRHAAGVARTLATFAGPDRDALDDLTQEVFFRIIDRISSYVPSHPFAHWLYTIALNVGRNHVRQGSKVVVLEPSEFDGIPGRNTCTADWSEEIMGVVLMRLAAQLPDHLREIVSLRIGSGMSHGEIAEVLGIPEGTARSRLYNALSMLRGKLGLTKSKKEKR